MEDQDDSLIALPVYSEDAYELANAICVDLAKQGLPVFLPPDGLGESVHYDEELLSHVLFAFAVIGSEESGDIEVRYTLNQLERFGIPLFVFSKVGDTAPDYLRENAVTVLDYSKPKFLERVRLVFDSLMAMPHHGLPERLDHEHKRWSLLRSLPFPYRIDEQPHSVSLRLPIGASEEEAYCPDLRELEHVLCYGRGDKDKNEYIKRLVAALLRQNGTKKIEFAIFDPLAELDGLYYLKNLRRGAIATQKQEMYDLIYDLEDEMHRRLQMFDEVNLSWTIKEWNEHAKEPLPYIIVIVSSIQRTGCADGVGIVAKVGHQAGIHFIATSFRENNEFHPKTKIRFRGEEAPIEVTCGKETKTLYRSYCSSLAAREIIQEHSRYPGEDLDVFAEQIERTRKYEFITADILMKEFGINRDDALDMIQGLRRLDVIEDLRHNEGYKVRP